MKKDGYPKRLATKYSNFLPVKSNHSINEAKFRFDWIFIIGLIGSFAALLFSYNALSEEKYKGTFRLNSICGASRFNILLSKFLSIFTIFFLSFGGGILFSLFIIIALFGGIEFIFISKILLFFVIALIFISFFIWSGLYISMKKNIQSSIVTTLAFWLLFVIIIPKTALVIGEKITPIKNQTEYQMIESSAWEEEIKTWEDRYDNLPDGNHVGGNGHLEDGLRGQAYYASLEAYRKKYNERNNDYRRQIETVEMISSISPYFLFGKINETLLDLGLYRYNNILKQLEEKRNSIEKVMKEVDSKDQKSYHSFYGRAYIDSRNVKDVDIFTTKAYPDKNQLVFKYNPEKFGSKLSKIIYQLFPLIMLNLIIIIMSFLKINKYDIR